jgi:hypothetical protein
MKEDVNSYEQVDNDFTWRNEEIYKINKYSYLIRKGNRCLLTDLKRCLKMTKFNWTNCASVCSNYIVIGGYNQVIIFDFDLNEILHL